MATTRPFAYNPGAPINGTSQYGNIAFGNISEDYGADYGGFKWWMGPDESLGYFIVYPDPTNSHPSEIPGVYGSLGFIGVKTFSTEDLINLTNLLPARNGLTPFTNVNDAYDWLINNGHWTNYNPTTPTPTPTPSSTVTITPTPTPTITSTPTPTATSLFDVLLMEDGFNLLQEDNTKIIL
jgi:hypothetical protein